MATSRIPNGSSSVHTSENILAKLDTDLTDSERKSFVDILWESPETACLLAIAVLQWEIKMREQQIEIERYKEHVRVKNCYIEINKENRSFGWAEKVEKMQLSVNQDSLDLEKIQSAYKISRERADKTINVIPEVDEQVKLSPKK